MPLKIEQTLRRMEDVFIDMVDLAQIFDKIIGVAADSGTLI